MKITSLFLTATLASFSSHAFADAQCLRYASNAEILSELSYRLGLGGNGASVALGSFQCDGSANVQISFVSDDGRESRQAVRSGRWDSCRNTAALLSRTRARVTQTVLVAVCDGSANVQRFSVTPQGKITLLQPVNLGQWDACDAQAAAINQ